MKCILTIAGLCGCMAASGCAEQMVQQDVNKHCVAQGKRAFVTEAEHQGIPLFLESAGATYYCVAPEDIKSTPAGFGTEVIEGADFKGVGVMTVLPGSIADKAGVRAGDIVYEFAGLPIARSLDLRSAIQSTVAGERVPIKLRRNKVNVTATAQF